MIIRKSNRVVFVLGLMWRDCRNFNLRGISRSATSSTGTPACVPLTLSESFFKPAGVGASAPTFLIHRKTGLQPLRKILETIQEITTTAAGHLCSPATFAAGSANIRMPSSVSTASNDPSGDSAARLRFRYAGPFRFTENIATGDSTS